MILREGSFSPVVPELDFRVTCRALGISGLVSPLVHTETIFTGNSEGDSQNGSWSMGPVMSLPLILKEGGWGTSCVASALSEKQVIVLLWAGLFRDVA